MKQFTLRKYNCKTRPCDRCGERFKPGDRIVKTARRSYHERCFQQLLH
ncbi:MAG: hypothetical protein WHU54_03905 [Candidatus Bathyarchaeia archaeon]